MNSDQKELYNKIILKNIKKNLKKDYFKNYSYISEKPIYMFLLYIASIVALGLGFSLIIAGPTSIIIGCMILFPGLLMAYGIFTNIIDYCKKSKEFKNYKKIKKEFKNNQINLNNKLELCNYEDDLMYYIANIKTYIINNVNNRKDIINLCNKVEKSYIDYKTNKTKLSSFSKDVSKELDMNEKILSSKLLKICYDAFNASDNYFKRIPEIDELINIEKFKTNSLSLKAK